MEKREIGAKISKLRQDFGLTKRSLAKELGIGYSTLCAYEYGTRCPSDEVKIRIAKLFGQSVSQIFYAHENNET